MSIREGEVRHFGLSEAGVTTICWARATRRPWRSAPDCESSGGDAEAYSAVRHGCFSVDGSWLAAGRAGAIHVTAETLQKMKVGITGVTYTRKSQRLLGESSGWMAE